jgi:hypothetical protein
MAGTWLEHCRDKAARNAPHLHILSCHATADNAVGVCSCGTEFKATGATELEWMHDKHVELAVMAEVR